MADDIEERAALARRGIMDHSDCARCPGCRRIGGLESTGGTDDDDARRGEPTMDERLLGIARETLRSDAGIPADR